MTEEADFRRKTAASDGENQSI